ncbi:hypothetical protein JIR001_28730 [Polycladomyces abyssicola]|uniref:Uncharacterized protein n=1 Tax=Polycladomyces abyssicola TaxID=1125966 RepID=A0A8D5UH07_9BACL|nr:hypothetical protein [Polycladomyces abyssicola]BCU83090.1 hypothetical protein JIR001_28730 [Polycladomyces abyssicola]
MNDVVKYSVNLRFQSFRFVAIGPKEDRHCLRQTVEVYRVDENMALFGYSYNLPCADALRREHPYPEQWTQTVVKVATDIRIETLHFAVGSKADCHCVQQPVEVSYSGDPLFGDRLIPIDSPDLQMVQQTDRLSLCQQWRVLSLNYRTQKQESGPTSDYLGPKPLLLTLNDLPRILLNPGNRQVPWRI